MPGKGKQSSSKSPNTPRLKHDNFSLGSSTQESSTWTSPQKKNSKSRMNMHDVDYSSHEGHDIWMLQDSDLVMDVKWFEDS